MKLTINFNWRKPSIMFAGRREWFALSLHSPHVQRGKIMDKKSLVVGMVFGLVVLALAKKFGGATVNNAIAKVGL